MVVNIARDVGSQIRDARKKKGLRQKDLGEQIGVQQRRISVIETDPSKTELSIIIKACKALGLIIDITPLSRKPSGTDEGLW